MLDDSDCGKVNEELAEEKSMKNLQPVPIVDTAVQSPMMSATMARRLRVS